MVSYRVPCTYPGNFNFVGHLQEIVKETTPYPVLQKKYQFQ